MREHRGLLSAAMVLIVLGIGGMTLTAVVLSATRTGPPQREAPATREQGGGVAGSFASPGERIYYTGVGEDGPIDVEWDTSDRSGGMMRPRGRSRMRMGCVRCHREDGRGGAIGMMGGAVAADIRYGTLTSPHVENGEQEEPWSDADIARAVRKGIEPSGDRLSPIMPRWKMSAGDMEATIDYLKELDER